MSSKNRYYAKVMNGTLDQTPGGLTKKDIKTVKNKDGTKRYVSKAKSKVSKNNFTEWNKAVRQAKKELGYSRNEFILIKGKLLNRAREIYYN